MNKYYYDLHIHSCLSPCGDDDNTPNNIAGMATLCGLNIVALTDHNTCKNCEAAMQAGEQIGLVVVPGMELTTREEAHMLAYFKTVEEAVAFSDVIYAHLPPIPNNAKFFGEQQRMNAQDEVVGIEERLLISALDLSFEECAELIHAHGGLCVPAHINRGSNGCLNALGFLPSGVAYDALEISRAVAPPAMDVSGYRVLHSSDAHYLENILEPEFTIEAADRSAEALFHAIQGKT